MTFCASSCFFQKSSFSLCFSNSSIRFLFAAKSKTVAQKSDFIFQIFNFGNDFLHLFLLYNKTIIKANFHKPLQKSKLLV
ncbi:MAG: hypothetical protein A2359_00910 [Candidatus Moranbacteria bacterium RIFOXYB1_FULL_43_19]|nr:MAG: hypothetical protein A2184_00310 [Candidatus Moranbacteria bacterium RIFOXYA1_FULL_44_7]OGI27347.1 MAG: hypothetical protein A2359_00910 [Candidatus Moranbacteria bacterium RIFOXYB1_FULL_43_19]OGI33851.1 MAG: hypothetical protein A2420_05550 [Candidatus Moranbacteria bacterium RIFOXYC1_FULL_44_13]OGI38798.1 MAG: hypothetical protein A2612_01210 [Candidatus Moranbacteria bacterium RIFOXYD1_FULL_44_12]